MRPFFNEDFKRALTVSLVRQKVAAVRTAIQKHSVQNTEDLKKYKEVV